MPVADTTKCRWNRRYSDKIYKCFQAVPLESRKNRVYNGYCILGYVWVKVCRADSAEKNRSNQTE